LQIDDFRLQIAAQQSAIYNRQSVMNSASLCFAALLVLAQSRDERLAWNAPVEPFRIIGNIYYVGAAGVSAFLIHTPDGSILLDGGLPETAPHIADSVSKLKFDLRGIKYLLNSHPHFDHSGGLAELKRRSGAAMVAIKPGAAALRAGDANAPAVAVERVIADGETVSVGGTTLTAHHTPGHTTGCTSWSTTVREDARDYRVFFHCSTSVVEPLVGNSAYPEIAADYRRTFAAIEKMEADVFLAPHPDFFHMHEKRARQQAGEKYAFVDPRELRRFNARSKRQFEEALEKQRQK
jgi:metallo-beta-lactamase class B